MNTRAFSLAMGLVLTAPAWALEGPAPVAAPAADSVAAPTAAHAGNGKSVHLGKIEVQGVKPLVETLQEVKLAVKRPFDNDPAHFDDMVCRLGGNELGSHVTRTLECGTQGWFAMRRNSYQFGNFMVEGAAVAVSTLGHPWHVVRELNPRQIAVLRGLLRELPPPGLGQVKVVNDGKAPLEWSH